VVCVCIYLYIYILIFDASVTRQTIDLSSAQPARIIKEKEEYKKRQKDNSALSRGLGVTKSYVWNAWE